MLISILHLNKQNCLETTLLKDSSTFAWYVQGYKKKGCLHNEKKPTHTLVRVEHSFKKSILSK